MSRLVGVLVCVTAPLVCTVLAQPASDSTAVRTTRITYAEAKGVFRELREDLLPAELRGKPPADIEAMWPDFLARRDAAIRARVDRGDEDSIVNLTLFGVMFTRQPRTDMREILKLIGDGRAGELIRGQPVQARLNDVVGGIASPGTNERLQFAADVAKRLGFDPATQSGRSALRTYLEQSIRRVFAEYESSFSASGLLAPYNARGLATDTSVLPNFAVERALEAIKAAGLLKPRGVRSVAIVGPGLDFADKREGHDFYPQQTLQPFAVVDSLLRLELAPEQDLRVTTFDVSPRITAHLEAARHRVGAGESYSLVLPLDAQLPWNPDLIAYWKRFGDRIGAGRAVPDHHQLLGICSFAAYASAPGRSSASTRTR
jgi:hypothetical protein